MLLGLAHGSRLARDLRPQTARLQFLGDEVPRQLVPVSPHFFFGGRVSLKETTEEKSGTLILTSLLEEVVELDFAG